MFITMGAFSSLIEDWVSEPLFPLLASSPISSVHLCTEAEGNRDPKFLIHDSPLISHRSMGLRMGIVFPIYYTLLFWIQECQAIYFSFLIFHQNIVALQCCVSFYCTARWISNMYTYVPSFFGFLPIYVTTQHWIEIFVLYSRFSLVIYFIHSSVYMLLPISQFIPSSISCLVSISLFSTSGSLFLLSK